MFYLFLLIIQVCFSFRVKPTRFVHNPVYGSHPTLWDALSAGLKDSARSWFILRAERVGIDWDAITYRYEKDLNKLTDIYEQVNNKSIEYPSYYTRPFHGYDTGNLNWLAALEGEAATLSMAVNYWKGNDPETTEKWLRHNITQNIQQYIDNFSANSASSILDVGCSIGISTEYLYNSFSKCKTISGLDLSPYFISLASYRAKELRLPIKYYHQNAETPSINEKFDLIVCNFVLHEVPRLPTEKILDSLTNLLNDGGVLAIVDLDPTKVQNNMVVDTFRKWAFEVTEPHIYEYYQTDMTELMDKVGLQQIRNVSNDPINSIWMGMKPIADNNNNNKRKKQPNALYFNSSLKLTSI